MNEEYKLQRIKEIVLFYDKNSTEGTELTHYITNLNKENEILKHRLNDIIFDDANDDVELGARYLRNIGYIDFDDEKKIYINKHNNEPFWQNDEREKDYYIQDEELNEYTKQLESKVKILQKELEFEKSIKKETREYIWSTKYEYGDLEEDNEDFDIDVYKILEILDKENK